VVAFKDTAVYIWYYEIHLNTAKTRMSIDESTIYFNKGKHFFREKRVYLFLPRSLGKIELEAQWACAVHLSFCFEET
jgi:hypothetical protein